MQALQTVQSIWRLHFGRSYQKTVSLTARDVCETRLVPVVCRVGICYNDVKSNIIVFIYRDVKMEITARPMEIVKTLQIKDAAL